MAAVFWCFGAFYRNPEGLLIMDSGNQNHSVIPHRALSGEAYQKHHLTLLHTCLYVARMMQKQSELLITLVHELRRNLSGVSPCKVDSLREDLSPLTEVAELRHPG